VVAEMLTGVDIPPGLDITELTMGDLDRDWYQVGVQVAGTVACGWFDRWFTATDAGDTDAAAIAASALAGSREWPVLQQMAEEGDYPEGLWEYADALAGDGPLAGELTRATIDSGFGCGWGFAEAVGPTVPTTTSVGLPDSAMRG
jgi:hypothetical protein